MEEGWFCKPQISTYCILYKEYVCFMDHVFAIEFKKLLPKESHLFFYLFHLLEVLSIFILHLGAFWPNFCVRCSVCVYTYFCLCMSNYSRIVYLKYYVSFPWNCFCFFVKDNYISVYFWALYSIPLFYLSFLLPFVVSLKIR